MGKKSFLNRTHLCFLLIALAALLVTDSALAANVLDNVTKTYESATGKWLSSLTDIAKSIFGKLAMIELLWSLCWWLMEKEDPNQWLVAFLRKILGLLFFWAIIFNFDTWIPSIINGFTYAGEKATGLTGLTPSAVLDRGLELSTKLTEVINAMGFFDSPGRALMASLAALVILLAFGVIAGQMLVTLVESYFCVSGGVIFLGFAGSRWTTSMAEKYLSYCVSVGTKLFVTYLVIGAGQTLSDTWASMFSQDMQSSAYLEVTVGALVYMFLAWQIPSLASSMMSGAVSMTLGAAAATVATTAGAALGGAQLASSAVQGATKGAAGMVQAATAAYGQATQNGAGTFAEVAKGMAQAVGSAAAGATSDAIKGLGSNSTGGRLADRINATTAAMQEAAAAGSSSPSVPGGNPPDNPGGGSAGGSGPNGGAPGSAGNGSTQSAGQGQGQGNQKGGVFDRAASRLQQVAQTPNDSAAGAGANISLNHNQH